MPKGEFKSPQEVEKLLQLLFEDCEEDPPVLRREIWAAANALHWPTGQDEDSILELVKVDSLDGIYD